MKEIEFRGQRLERRPPPNRDFRDFLQIENSVYFTKSDVPTRSGCFEHGIPVETRLPTHLQVSNGLNFPPTIGFSTVNSHRPHHFRKCMTGIGAISCCTFGTQPRDPRRFPVVKTTFLAACLVFDAGTIQGYLADKKANPPHRTS